MPRYAKGMIDLSGIIKREPRLINYLFCHEGPFETFKKRIEGFGKMYDGLDHLAQRGYKNHCMGTAKDEGLKHGTPVFNAEEMTDAMSFAVQIVAPGEVLHTEAMLEAIKELKRNPSLYAGNPHRQKFIEREGELRRELAEKREKLSRHTAILKDRLVIGDHPFSYDSKLTEEIAKIVIEMERIANS